MLQYVIRKFFISKEQGKFALSVLSIVQVTKEDKSFQNIMKCYRSQPQASSSVSVSSVHL